MVPWWTLLLVGVVACVAVGMWLWDATIKAEVTTDRLDQEFKVGVESGQERMRRELLDANRKYGKRYEIQIWDWQENTLDPNERMRWIVWDADRLIDDESSFNPAGLLLNNTPIAMGNSSTPLAAYADALSQIGQHPIVVQSEPIAVQL